MSGSIHTVTTIPYHPADPWEKRRSHFQRCWGFYHTREEARDGLKYRCDDECGYYNYAIIEEFEPGIYTAAKNEEWYMYDFNAREWLLVAKPEFSVNTINYGIG